MFYKDISLSYIKLMFFEIVIESILFSKYLVKISIKFVIDIDELSCYYTVSITF
jgi:hypothetical protein